MKKFKRGFTLAEVLIVLGIIGVVAEMTIPTLIINTNEKVTIVAVKKAFSTLSQAYNMAVTENGTPDAWGLTTDSAGANKLGGYIIPYLRIIKNCETTQNAGCFANFYKSLIGFGGPAPDSDTGLYKILLADGISVGMRVMDVNCAQNWGDSLALNTICGKFSIDTNGLKGPNITGKDYFEFYFTKNGVVPTGSIAEYVVTFDNSCLTLGGHGCAAWVIYNDNMDYLHCTDLSWDGKNKCD